MFVELVCNCGASIQVERSDAEDALWLLATRFVEAHTICGFVTDINRDSTEQTTRYDLKFKPRNRKYADGIEEEDEDDDDGGFVTD
jgi:hypothetical protein